MLKNMYLAFRTERPQYHINEDVVVCLTPRVAGDNPIHETQQTTWKSLQALGNTHMGPNIGGIRVSQEDAYFKSNTRMGRGHFIQ